MTGLSELFRDLADEAKFYDVTEGALRGARRRRRVRLAAAPAAVGAVAVVVAAMAVRADVRPDPGPLATPTVTASPAPARVLPKACVPQVLPLAPGYTHGMVVGGDPTGRLLVGVLDLSYERTRSVIWADGKIQLLSPPGLDNGVTDINSAGTAIGNSLVKRKGWEVESAWVYHDGGYTVLKGESSQAYGINEHGVIVGNVEGRPAVWRSLTAEPQLLATDSPADSGFIGSAFDIDDDGFITGRLDSPRPAPALWRPDGTVDSLPDARFFNAMSNGWVLGSGSAGSARWNLRTKQMEPISQIGAVLINAQGWTAGADANMNVTVIAGDEVLEVPDPAGVPLHQIGLSVLADDGRTIAGWYGGDPNGEKVVTAPVVWRCS